ncbi:3-deoxy-manno-octulosonate cytidylyltransferase [uncultured Sneathiella sp.]|mgnify:FL=1|jgi:3-deoxy-manno-octulosonate cytidylyltransferase (CMP-KDO synthetase)|uniref:3-deoxy-manno-octulosonate cytidylyltransferase n=1 Tax=uncultured Sneathiella sp. TaxID=879315 RepID=UPI0030DA1F7A|tara:strand:+ start:621 stop:1367 length:747 start_codon:yes stop_codon:yes gene_type:complete
MGTSTLKPLIVIPARMASTRLPGKPLADIAGLPMIVQVLRRAEEADIGPAIVACGEEEIAAAVKDAGGNAILTRSDHPSGSDRVFEAVKKFDPDGIYNAIVNLQGDLPALEPAAIAAVFQPLQNVAVDIATLVAEITDPEELEDENAVKAVVSLKQDERIGRALWFSRLKSPWGPGPHYHHIGLYTYRRAALERFVALPPAPLEQRERLEQLRALENGMRIDAAVVDTVPLGVDTPEDLARIRRMFVS